MDAPFKITQCPQIMLTLAMVFVAGGAAGALSMKYGLHERLHPVAAASKPPKPPTNEAVVQRFKSELDLTPDQASRIGVVLEDFSHYYESLQEQQADLRATGKGRIVEILNPDQRQKFEKMMAELAPQLTK
jgi:hypothetical protein